MAVALSHTGTEAAIGTVEVSDSRRSWIDNLRVAVIAAVIVVHVSATYAVQMPWYYEERSAGIATQAVLSALFGPGVFYAMAVLFLIAGMLSPRSLERKGTGRFVTARLLRLGLSVVVGVWVVIPVTALIGALAEGEANLMTAGPFLLHAALDLDFGPMWFVAALLIFSLAYSAVRRIRPRVAPRQGPVRWWHLVAAGAAIAIGSFSIRLVWPALSVTPGHLNLWEWPTMATLFVLGILAGERGWLDPVPESMRRVCGWSGIVALVAATLFFAAVAITGDDRLLGGWHLQAVVGPLIEGVLAVSVPIWLLTWFRRRWTQHGPVLRAAGRSSYAAYVFHPLVIVLIAIAFRLVPVAAEVKFVTVAGLGVLVSFTVAWLLTQIRPLRRVF
ncbi:MAG TPA: acyltransferase [Candidatus Dormibacteraeota bacterium]|nr:acyltransferase [Candidatus Dormibacteraeota bacterium]